MIISLGQSGQLPDFIEGKMVGRGNVFIDFGTEITFSIQLFHACLRSNAFEETYKHKRLVTLGFTDLIILRVKDNTSTKITVKFVLNFS